MILFKPTFEITTMIGCRNHCSYCPQDRIIREYHKISNIDMLSMDMFKKTLERLPNKSFLCFAGFVEPFFNPCCSDMILFANRFKHRITVNTTLVNVSKEDLDKIKGVPFYNFCVHLQGVDEHWFSVEEYLERLRVLHSFNIHNLCFVYGYNVDDRVRVLLKSFGYEVYPLNLVTRAGSVVVDSKMLKNPFQRRNICKERRLRKSIMLPDGTIVLCCMDWGISHNLGNILSFNSFDDIYRTSVFKQIKKSYKKFNCDNVICKDCEFLIPVFSRYLVFYLINTLFNENIRRNIKKLFVRSGLYENVWKHLFWKIFKMNYNNMGGRQI